MIRVLRGDDLGEQPGAGPALFDRCRRPLGCDHRALARLAGVGEAHVLGDEQRGRLVVELLARLLADLDQARAAGRTGAALLRQRVLHPPAGQQRGQRRAAVAAWPWGRRCRRRRLRLSLLRLHPAGELKQQLRGIELLGASAVEVAAEQGKLVRELVDELLLLAQLREQLPQYCCRSSGSSGNVAGATPSFLRCPCAGHGFRATTILSAQRPAVTPTGGGSGAAGLPSRDRSRRAAAAARRRRARGAPRRRAADETRRAPVACTRGRTPSDPRRGS